MKLLLLCIGITLFNNGCKTNLDEEDLNPFFNSNDNLKIDSVLFHYAHHLSTFGSATIGFLSNDSFFYHVDEYELVGYGNRKTIKGTYTKSDNKITLTPISIIIITDNNERFPYDLTEPKIDNRSFDSTIDKFIYEFHIFEIDSSTILLKNSIIDKTLSNYYPGYLPNDFKHFEEYRQNFTELLKENYSLFYFENKSILFNDYKAENLKKEIHFLSLETPYANKSNVKK